MENGEIHDQKTEWVDMSMLPQEKEYWDARVRNYKMGGYLLWALFFVTTVIVACGLATVIFALSQT